MPVPAIALESGNSKVPKKMYIQGAEPDDRVELCSRCVEEWKRGSEELRRGTGEYISFPRLLEEDTEDEVEEGKEELGGKGGEEGEGSAEKRGGASGGTLRRVWGYLWSGKGVTCEKE